ncbi:M56 family metallopeptidase [Paenibacillus sp. WQ 127069]|uniref:M56 family metallopeptidase n=1 Tax=Paenibacillus baimaensis TaxID=2982185 RepID=A0ABT2URY7_9BACL|nr:M56 family metallopeptidase [Paenibacillus sp. WQ 127069]MCU6797435.1 M56 family metallopeptidase [Paenibacillus sp. WQ 127069]
MSSLLKPSMAICCIYVVAAWILLQMGMALSHHISDVELQPDMWLVIQNMLFDLVVGHSFFETVFILLIGLTCLRMLTYMGRHLYASYNWYTYAKVRMHPRLTTQWTRKYKKWHTHIDVIREQQPVAFVIGMIHPRIVISTGLLDMLSLEEVHAVLLHERYHCTQRHPLKKWLATMIITSMPYMSILKGLGHYYDIWIELLADRYAITQTNSTYTIGTALLKLVQTQRFVNPCQGVSFSDTAINYRLSQLINPEQSIEVPMVSLRSVCTSGTVLIVISMIIFFQCI